jgi:xanthine dehydrogenase accessory factor
MTAPLIVRGGGELATAAARLLFFSGFPVAVLERAEPLAVRRLVSFSEAVLAGTAIVEGVLARRVTAEALTATREHVQVAVDPDGTAIARLRPDVIVDARMRKQTGETRRADAALVVGLGPGFVAGDDVHAVVETQRGPDLGRVLWSGAAEADSARPAPVLGHTDDRVIRAPRAGRFHAHARIGDLVLPAQVVASVDGEPVRATIGGLLRGLLPDGIAIAAGVKVGDIDPRGRAVDPARISDKARAVAAGVLEAVLVGRGMDQNLR